MLGLATTITLQLFEQFSFVKIRRRKGIAYVVGVERVQGIGRKGKRKRDCFSRFSPSPLSLFVLATQAKEVGGG